MPHNVSIRIGMIESPPVRLVNGQLYGSAKTYFKIFLDFGREPRITYVPSIPLYDLQSGSIDLMGHYFSGRPGGLEENTSFTSTVHNAKCGVALSTHLPRAEFVDVLSSLAIFSVEFVFLVLLSLSVSAYLIHIYMTQETRSQLRDRKSYAWESSLWSTIRFSLTRNCSWLVRNTTVFRFFLSSVVWFNFLLTALFGTNFSTDLVVLTKEPFIETIEQIDDWNFKYLLQVEIPCTQVLQASRSKLMVRVASEAISIYDTSDLRALTTLGQSAIGQSVAVILNDFEPTYSYLFSQFFPDRSIRYSQTFAETTGYMLYHKYVQKPVKRLIERHSQSYLENGFKNYLERAVYKSNYQQFGLNWNNQYSKLITEINGFQSLSFVFFKRLFILLLIVYGLLLVFEFIRTLVFQGIVGWLQDKRNKVKVNEIRTLSAYQCQTDSTSLSSCLIEINCQEKFNGLAAQRDFFSLFP